MSISSESNTDKFKLIYEFNRKSPLFALVAAEEIEHGNISDAIKILEAGLPVHPHYPTPYFIMALAKACAGDKDSAIKFARSGSSIIGSTESFELYKKKIAEIISERNAITEAKGPDFLDGKEEAASQKTETELDVLAAKLSKAKISAKEISKDAEELSTPQYNGKIVSETMAEIYISQKNFEEAISTYNELMLLKPEKIDFYENRIEEIKMMME